MIACNMVRGLRARPCVFPTQMAPCTFLTPASQRSTCYACQLPTRASPLLSCPGSRLHARRRLPPLHPGRLPAQPLLRPQLQLRLQAQPLQPKRQRQQCHLRLHLLHRAWLQPHSSRLQCQHQARGGLLLRSLQQLLRVVWGSDQARCRMQAPPSPTGSAAAQVHPLVRLEPQMQATQAARQRCSRVCRGWAAR